MTILVLCNIGLRDVILDGDPIKPPREMGEQLLKRLDREPDLAEQFSFPIIDPCLRYIFQQYPGEKIELTLFGSDQLDVKYNQSDTLYFARLAARLIPNAYPDQSIVVQAEIVDRINPALYDETYERFHELLSDRKLPDSYPCFVILAGGTPAMNSALLLQGVRHYGDCLHALYPPPERDPVPLRVGNQIAFAFREAAVIEHIDRLDFANSLPILAKLNITPGLVGLTDYAAQRLAFNFNRAQKIIEQSYQDGSPELRRFISDKLRHNLDDLLQTIDHEKRWKALLLELFWNAAITWSHRGFADFLGRIYRFQEAVLRYLVEQTYLLSTDLSPEVREAHQRSWEENLSEDLKLINYLTSRDINGQKLNWREISRPVYKALLSYLVEVDDNRLISSAWFIAQGNMQKFKALYKKVNALDPLIEMRHRTIIGHDFLGVSEEDIRQNYHQKDSTGRILGPVEGIQEILNMLSIRTTPNPYRLTADFIIQNIK